MQVKTKLHINIFISLITAFFIILLLFFAIYRFNKAVQDLDIANGILGSLYEKNALIFDYLRSGSGTAKEQWLSEHIQTGKLLNSALQRFEDAEHLKVIAEMIKNHQATMEFFNSIVENREKARSGEVSTEIYHLNENRLLNNANLRLYDNVLNINILRQAARENLTAALKQTGLCIALLIVFVSAIATIISWTMGRTMSHRIRRLREGAGIIGEGNLHHRINIKGNDEFAKLSEAFDAMTEKLSRSYQELENEIAERSRVEAERKVLISKLENANLELEGFTYSVSHDLRAPIRHLSAYAGLLEKETDQSLGEKGRLYLKTITDASLKLGILVDELLEFSRVGRTAMEESLVDLNFLIQEIIKILAEENRDRRIEWNVHPLPVVSGDPKMLQLAFTNLIGNSVKYTSNRTTAVIEIGSETNEVNEVIYVRDNGVGFDMKYYDKLFGIFQRLHTTEEFEGTGIGLANAKRIIERHGGRVWAISRIDEGATFYVSLPKAQ